MAAARRAVGTPPKATVRAVTISNVTIAAQAAMTITFDFNSGGIGPPPAPFVPSLGSLNSGSLAVEDPLDARGVAARLLH